MWRGHSLLQDSELFTLLKTQVSVVRGLIAVQGDNQVVCKDKRRQGELARNHLGTWASGVARQRTKLGAREAGQHRG